MVQEGQYLAVFNSAHRVMKAESLLKSLGLQILLIPAPRALQTECGLAIRFDDNRKHELLAALAGHDLMPAFVSRLVDGVYVRQEEVFHEDH